MSELLVSIAHHDIGHAAASLLAMVFMVVSCQCAWALLAGTLFPWRGTRSMGGIGLVERRLDECYAVADNSHSGFCK